MPFVQPIIQKLKNQIKKLVLFINDKIDERYPAFKGIFFDKDGKDEEALYKVLFSIIAWAVIVATLLFIINIPFSLFWSNSGQFGDFFGGVLNPFLTFFTLFGLIATIVIQRRELQLSRKEYEKTAEALNTQAIETTFFNLLDLHHKIADELKFDIEVEKHENKSSLLFENLPPGFPRETEIKNYRGRSCFEAIIAYITEGLKTPVRILDKYKDFQENNNHILGHYFRNLYQALKVIDSYDDEFLNEKQKSKYASILRAQLSSNELALLFLNCLRGVCDSGQFKNLLVKYSMLEHLPITRNGEYFHLAHKIIVDKDMILQFQKEEIIKIELNKCLGGAFGRNRGIPYNLNKLDNKSLRK